MTALVDTTTGEVVAYEPTTALEVSARCATLEQWAASSTSVAEVKHEADKLAAINEYLSRNSIEGRARVAATRLRLECRIGVLLGEAEIGRNQHTGGGFVHDQTLHPSLRSHLRQMAANVAIGRREGRRPAHTHREAEVRSCPACVVGQVGSRRWS